MRRQPHQHSLASGSGPGLRGSEGADAQNGASAVQKELGFRCNQKEFESVALLEIIVGEQAAVLQLLAREDEALMLGGDALLVLDQDLDAFDVVRSLDFEDDGIAEKLLDDNLHRVC